MVNDLDFEFSPEKNSLLKGTRGVNFDDIVLAVENGGLIRKSKHLNRIKYPHQKILVVKVNDYICVVPYVITKDKKAFLKTVYPSRKLKKIYT